MAKPFRGDSRLAQDRAKAPGKTWETGPGRRCRIWKPHFEALSWVLELSLNDLGVGVNLIPHPRRKSHRLIRKVIHLPQPLAQVADLPDGVVDVVHKRQVVRLQLLGVLVLVLVLLGLYRELRGSPSPQGGWCGWAPALGRGRCHSCASAPGVLRGARRASW